jgi:hypothetical protein
MESELFGLFSAIAAAKHKGGRASEAIESWLIGRQIDLSGFKPRAKRSVINRLECCATVVTQAVARARDVIADAQAS